MLLDPTKLPRHVAIIMDGNGRWAQRRGLPRVEGHRRGAVAVREVVRAAREVGLRALTLYAFSSQNWQRPPEEVGTLMQLLRDYVIDERDAFRRQVIDPFVEDNLAGRDRQLETAVEELLRQLGSNKRNIASKEEK